jgi:hypothetical protein
MLGFPGCACSELIPFSSVTLTSIKAVPRFRWPALPSYLNSKFPCPAAYSTLLPGYLTGFPNSTSWVPSCHPKLQDLLLPSIHLSPHVTLPLTKSVTKCITFAGAAITKPQDGWLRQKKCIVSQVWRLEVCGQGVGSWLPVKLWGFHSSLLLLVDRPCLTCHSIIPDSTSSLTCAYI